MFFKLVKSFSKLWNFHHNNKPPKLRVLQTHQHNLQEQQISKNALNVVNKLQKAGFQAFLVGGCVRDLLLGIKPKDFDVVTNATPDQIKRTVPRSRVIGRRFRLVHVHFGSGHEIIEVATFRANSNTKKSHTGRVLRDNVYGTFEEDAFRRDFTINALYFDPFNEQIFDFGDGMHHLKRKRICVIGNSAERYQEDPVRMLRAIRFLAKLSPLGFTLEHTATINIDIFSYCLDNVPPARLYDEVIKLFFTGHAVRTYEALAGRFFLLFNQLFANALMLNKEHDTTNTYLIRTALPEIAKDVKELSYKNLLFTETLKFIDQKKAGVELFFATLLLECLEREISYLPHLSTNQAIIETTDIVFKKCCPNLDVPHKVIADVRDIWLIQDRLLNRRKRTAFKVIKHPNFKNSLKFLYLFEKTQPQSNNLARWWQTFAKADELTQKDMINNPNKPNFKKRTNNNHQKKKYKRPTKVNLHNIEHHA